MTDDTARWLSSVPVGGILSLYRSGKMGIDLSDAHHDGLISFRFNGRVIDAGEAIDSGWVGIDIVRLK